MKIPASLLQIKEKNTLKLTIDSFSSPEIKEKYATSHFICALNDELVVRCFPHSIISKRHCFTIVRLGFLIIF